MHCTQQSRKITLRPVRQPSSAPFHASRTAIELAPCINMHVGRGGLRDEGQALLLLPVEQSLKKYWIATNAGSSIAPLQLGA